METNGTNNGKKVYKNMNYRNGIRLIGTYSCHGWPWDTNLVSKCPLCHSLLLFALWVSTPIGIHYRDVANVVNP
jgi:hypothetical protein